MLVSQIRWAARKIKNLERVTMDMTEFQIEQIGELESMLADVDVHLSDASVGTSWINTIDFLQRAESSTVSLLNEIRLKILSC